MDKTSKKISPEFPISELLVGSKQVARMLNVSTKTVNRLRRRGKMPQAIQVGGSIRWRLEEVERWVRLGCPPPETSADGK